jgi:hypothetical protein
MFSTDHLMSRTCSEDGLVPHLPLPAALAASSSSAKRAPSGDCLTPSRRTVTRPSETNDSVMFSAELKSFPK